MAPPKLIEVPAGETPVTIPERLRRGEVPAGRSVTPLPPVPSAARTTEPGLATPDDRTLPLEPLGRPAPAARQPPDDLTRPLAPATPGLSARPPEPLPLDTLPASGETARPFGALTDPGDDRTRPLVPLRHGPPSTVPPSPSSGTGAPTESLDAPPPRVLEQETRLRPFPGRRPAGRKWPAITFSVLGGACVVLLLLLANRHASSYRPPPPRPGVQAPDHDPVARPIGSSLVPPSGSVRVSATSKGQPVAAQLWVDGRALGRTPLDVAGLDPGVHDLHLELEGAGGADAKVSVPPPAAGAEHGETVEVSLDRAPAPGP